MIELLGDSGAAWHPLAAGWQFLGLGGPHRYHCALLALPHCPALGLDRSGLGFALLALFSYCMSFVIYEYVCHRGQGDTLTNVAGFTLVCPAGTPLSVHLTCQRIELLNAAAASV